MYHPTSAAQGRPTEEVKTCCCSLFSRRMWATDIFDHTGKLYATIWSTQFPDSIEQARRVARLLNSEEMAKDEMT